MKYIPSNSYPGTIVMLKFYYYPKQINSDPQKLSIFSAKRQQ